jgi:hypothetical protein
MSGSRNQCAEDHAKRADLVLHGVVIVLAELYGPAAEDLPGQGVAALLQAGLRLDLPAVAGFAGQAQGVQGLGDPPVAGDGISSRSALYGKKNRFSSERGGTRETPPAQQPAHPSANSTGTPDLRTVDQHDRRRFWHYRTPGQRLPVNCGGLAPVSVPT